MSESQEPQSWGWLAGVLVALGTLIGGIVTALATAVVSLFRTKAESSRADKDQAFQQEQIEQHNLYRQQQEVIEGQGVMISQLQKDQEGIRLRQDKRMEDLESAHNKRREVIEQEYRTRLAESKSAEQECLKEHRQTKQQLNKALDRIAALERGYVLPTAPKTMIPQKSPIVLPLPGEDDRKSRSLPLPPDSDKDQS